MRRAGGNDEGRGTIWSRRERRERREADLRGKNMGN